MTPGQSTEPGDPRAEIERALTDLVEGRIDLQAAVERIDTGVIPEVKARALEYGAQRHMLLYGQRRGDDSLGDTVAARLLRQIARTIRRSAERSKTNNEGTS